MSKFSEITDSRQLDYLLKGLYSKVPYLDSKKQEKNIKYDVHVVAKDKLKGLTPQANQVIIINLNRSDQMGSHWVCSINSQAKKEVCYFDSFGVKPIPEAVTFMKRYKKPIIYTTRQIQKVDEETCGWYVMAFLDQYILKNVPAYEAVYQISYRKTIQYGKKLFKTYLSKIF